jgi:hypothetical protein
VIDVFPLKAVGLKDPIARRNEIMSLEMGESVKSVRISPKGRSVTLLEKYER